MGLVLGSAGAARRAHLAKLRALVDRFEPALVSEHLCWGSAGARHANDLLPLPCTEESLALVVARIGEVQDRLGRRILVENVSTYLEFEASTIPEAQFVAEAARASGCGMLLDVNNVHVNAVNHGLDARGLPGRDSRRPVGEIHLAGHEAIDGLLIDTHGARVATEVWALYEAAVARFGPRPTLVEWDTDIPALDVLLAEAQTASAILGRAAAPSLVGEPP